jgi:hypothetical protein
MRLLPLIMFLLLRFLVAVISLVQNTAVDITFPPALVLMRLQLVDRATRMIWRVALHICLGGVARRRMLLMRRCMVRMLLKMCGMG